MILLADWVLAFLQLEQFRSEKKYGKVTKLEIAMKRQIMAKHLNHKVCITDFD
jgi:hypothetical protein